MLASPALNSNMEQGGVGGIGECGVGWAVKKHRTQRKKGGRASQGRAGLATAPELREQLDKRPWAYPSDGA